jgi:hypothetical protein
MRKMRITVEDRKAFRRIARLGAYARALSLTPERRREIAVHAIRTRWDRVRAQLAQQTEEAQQPVAATQARSD